MKDRRKMKDKRKLGGIMIKEKMGMKIDERKRK